jgi:hypothetical protein
MTCRGSTICAHTPGGRDKGRCCRRTGRVLSCRSGLRMAGSGEDGMSGWPSTTTSTIESGLGWRRLGFRRYPSRPISSNGTDDHATRRTEQRADDLGWELSRNSQSRPAPGAMGAASSVDMEESHAGGRGSRIARMTGLHGCRLHGSHPVQIAIWGKEHGKGGEVRRAASRRRLCGSAADRRRRRPATTMAASPG